MQKKAHVPVFKHAIFSMPALAEAAQSAAVPQGPSPSDEFFRTAWPVWAEPIAVEIESPADKAQIAAFMAGALRKDKCDFAVFVAESWVTPESGGGSRRRC